MSEPRRAKIALETIRQASSRGERMTALAHHAWSIPMLELAVQRLNRAACAGVDGVTPKTFRASMHYNIRQLSELMASGSYVPAPLTTTWIEKPCGGMRPIQIPTMQDRVAQASIAMVLGAVFDHEKLSENLCFGPKRFGATSTKVGIKDRWVFETDIEDCFGSIVRSKLFSVLGRKIRDHRMIALVERVSGEGKGIPQGFVTSPCLNDIYLTVAVDRWLCHWKVTRASGKVSFMRYVDDIIVTSTSAEDGEALKVDFARRLAKFGLSMKASKTQLHEKNDQVDYLGTTRAPTSKEFVAIADFRMRLAAKTERESLEGTLRHYRSMFSRRELDPVISALKVSGDVVAVS